MSGHFRIGVGVALSTVVASAAFAAPPDKAAFRPRVTYPTGTDPTSLAIGDVNRDGKPDVVVGSTDRNTAITVLFGRGEGSFRIGGPDVAPLGGPLFRVGIADINLDGKPDILACGGNVYVLQGRGGGTFEQTAAVPVNPDGACAYGDLNRDGKLDLVGSAVEFGYYLSLGDGRGHFGQLILSEGDGFSGGPYEVVDVNRDGVPDLIAAAEDYSENGFVDSTKIRLGNGDGTFGGGAVLPAASDVKVADLNFDAKPDIVLLDYGGGVRVGLGRGDGTFPVLKSFATGLHPVSVAVADINRDGKPDLVVADYGDDTISVLLGKGNGTFQPRQTFATGHGPSSVAVADLNQDGFLDVVVANSADNTVSVLLGTAP